MMANAVMSLDDALDSVKKNGGGEFTAEQVANYIWPDARTHNSNGQVFNLCAGVAGRMIRKSKRTVEIANRRWTII